MEDKNVNPTPVNSPEKKETAKGPHKSPKTPRITNSQKEKDPRKVAAGKKLGAISRMAKSQKKYKAEAHNMAEEKPTQEIPTFYIGLTVCAIVGVLGVVYLKTRTEQEVKPVLPEKQNPKSNLISLD